LPGGAVALIASRVVHSGAPTVREVAIAGGLVAFAGGLVAIARRLIPVGPGLVAVGRSLIGIRPGLVHIRAVLIMMDTLPNDFGRAQDRRNPLVSPIARSVGSIRRTIV
jgi:hypothetical protein